MPSSASCARKEEQHRPSAADTLCFCHTICHVGEHFELTVLDEFMTPWLELVGGRNPHAWKVKYVSDGVEEDFEVISRSAPSLMRFVRLSCFVTTTEWLA